MTLFTTLIITFAVMLTVIAAMAIGMLTVIAAMAIGVMNGRKPISGSCGGLNGGGCELCSGNCKREKEE
jgi:hypothetical protein